MLSPCKMTVSYDGRAYLGWQRHGEKPTVQYVIEEAIKKAFAVGSQVTGSGRTDRGVHARGQVAGVELPDSLSTEDINSQLNKVLPTDIRILDVSRAPDGFDACSSAVAKHYRYLIWNKMALPDDRDGRVWHVKRPLDARAMIAACSIFEGEHDFASFATRPNFKQKSTVRTVFKVAVNSEEPVIVIDIWADGFLYKMVRNIVRALVKVGEGRYDHERLRFIFAAKDRAAAPGTAPASGLYLEHVYYSDDELFQDIGKKDPA